MSYGIPEERGGDSEENVAEMDACVAAVKKRGMPEANAVRICKAKLGFTTDAEQADYERTRPKH